MARRTLIYHFTLASPWSYLGHAALMDLAAAHDLTVVWKPTDLRQVFPASGGLPLAKRHPKRQAYRDIELQRWRVARGLPLNLRPAFWPLETTLADRCICALVEDDLDPDRYVRQAFAGIWAADQNLDDPETVTRLLAAEGYDAAAVLARARSDGVAALYDAHARAALDAGVFGAPTYILDDEPFWGQDRLTLLAEALASGRAAFTA